MRKIYAEVLEESALEQFNDAMAQPYVVQGALMPDAHLGYSLPIGAVVATDGYVVPSWVGYDIGCGMCASILQGISKKDIIKNSEKIFHKIYDEIPVGFNINLHGADYSLDGLTYTGADIAMAKKYDRTLGSLGGGNHFIEIGFDESENVWIIIHSGSRGVGHGIASHYMTLASTPDLDELNESFDKIHVDLLKYNPDAYETVKASWVKKRIGKLKPEEGHYPLAVDSKDGKDYIQDMNWCLDYALANRTEIMRRTARAIHYILETKIIEIAPTINRNHNHAVEREGLWIHRKGATHAENGMLGVIPGNMLDGSFIVRGKGNPDSLYSSSHGAGRVLGRRQAMRELDLDTFQAAMKGVKALVTKDTLDESPLAYKNIYAVMEQQKDLVSVIAHVKPLINIKG